LGEQASIHFICQDKTLSVSRLTVRPFVSTKWLEQ